MTIKKNYERRDGGELRRPKRPAVKNRDEVRMKHALRHGDTSSFVDYTDEDFAADMEDELYYDEADSD